MAKRRNFMVSFSFPSDKAADFFNLFSPIMRLTDNFECTTVTDEVPDSEVESEVKAESEPEVKAESERQPSYDAWLTKTRAVAEEVKRNAGNPATSEEARERFRMAQRGLSPSAREILTTEFEGRDSFLLAEAIEALVRRGLSPRTAAPTLNAMKTKAQVEHVDTNRFRIKKELNGGASYHEEPRHSGEL